MKILFDHQIYIMQEYGGISRYFFELSKKLKNDLDVDVLNTTCLSNNVFTSDSIYKSSKFLPDYSFKGKGTILRLINEGHSKKELNKSFDIFHPTYYGTYFLDRIKKRPFVITVYDLIHEKFANSYNGILNDKPLFARRRQLFEKATKIIAISNSTKNDIIDIYKINPSKIEVVYLANSLSVTNAIMSHSFENYILYVGKRNEYKNFKPFIEAISELLIKESELKILCAGGDEFSLDELNFFKALNIQDQVIQVAVDDNLLATLYKNALFFVCPSLYEGFGIPILEAFACLCPAVLSNTSSLPEVGGDAALYFNPNDKNDILNKVSTLLHNSEMANKLKIAGFERQKLFSWSQTAIDHNEIYKKI